MNVTPRTLPTWMIASALACAAALSGCGADDPPAGTDGGTTSPRDATTAACAVEATFTSIHTNMLRKPVCSACHGFANAPAGGGTEFPADKAAAYAVMMGDTADVSRTPPKRVVAGNPQQSSFYLKLLASRPFGERMPLGLPPLADCEIAAVSTWITNGAAND